jgi:hypothetical protein
MKKAGVEAAKKATQESISSLDHSNNIDAYIKKKDSRSVFIEIR